MARGAPWPVHGHPLPPLLPRTQDAAPGCARCRERCASTATQPCPRVGRRPGREVVSGRQASRSRGTASAFITSTRRCDRHLPSVRRAPGAGLENENREHVPSTCRVLRTAPASPPKPRDRPGVGPLATPFYGGGNRPQEVDFLARLLGDDGACAHISSSLLLHTAGPPGVTRSLHTRSPTPGGGAGSCVCTRTCMRV